jgi:hypothetical protein
MSENCQSGQTFLHGIQREFTPVKYSSPCKYLFYSKVDVKYIKLYIYIKLSVPFECLVKYDKKIYYFVHRYSTAPAGGSRNLDSQKNVENTMDC